IQEYHSPSRPNVHCLLTLSRAPSWTASAGLSKEADDARYAPQAICDGSRGPGSSTATMVGAGGACVLGSADVVVVVVVVTVAGLAIVVAVAAFAGVVVVVLVAVGSTGGAGDFASAWASAVAAASVTAATITSPLALRAPRLWRCLRPIRATSAIEIHATIAPGPRCPPLVQP